jgi:hypothetical protein
MNADNTRFSAILTVSLSLALMCGMKDRVRHVARNANARAGIY